MLYRTYQRLKPGMQRIYYWERFNSIGEPTAKYKKDIRKYNLKVCVICGAIEDKPHALTCKNRKGKYG